MAYLLWKTVFDKVEVQIAFPLDVDGHDAPGGGQGAVVAAGGLHHVAEPEDVAQSGVGVPGVVGAHCVVDQVVPVIFVAKIGKPDNSGVRKPDNNLVKIKINEANAEVIQTLSSCKSRYPDIQYLI